jgi:hypothetical protein
MARTRGNPPHRTDACASDRAGLTFFDGGVATGPGVCPNVARICPNRINDFYGPLIGSPRGVPKGTPTHYLLIHLPKDTHVLPHRFLPSRPECGT